MSSLTTYLQGALKDNRIFRWPDKLMPLKVYIAPFRWYQQQKQQQEGMLYHTFVNEALLLWKQATNGKFNFVITDDYNNSNINVSWRRVDRKSLGLCHVDGTKDYMMFSAEVEIGISDGIIHARYQDTNEVKHTIIHEMGHAIGLPHSASGEDIMYVPHRYGIIQPSYRDINTAKWLYMLDPGFDPTPYKKDWGLEPSATIDELIWMYENQDQYASSDQPEQPDQVNDDTQQSPDKTIHDQQELLALRNLYNMSLQKINVDVKPANTPPKPPANTGKKTQFNFQQKKTPDSGNIFQ